MNHIKMTEEKVSQLISPSDLELLTSFNVSSLNLSSLCNITIPYHTSQPGPTLCNLSRAKAVYLPAHGYLALAVCIVGTIFNMVNIMVLTHKDMRSIPINLILTGIAVADCLVMLEYIPFTIHMYLMDGRIRDHEDRFSFSWAIFLLFHTNFSIMIHTVSIWLTLSLAIWRFIMIKYPTLSVSLCTISRCKTVLTLGYVIPLLLTIPSYFSSQIQTEKDMREDGSCVAFYSIKFPTFDGSDLMFSLNMWFYSFFLKLIPCVVLTIFTASLIHALYQVEESSARLKRSSQHESCTEEEKRPMMGRQRNTDRTTRLLVMILVLFIVAELPLGILGLLSAVWGKQFFLECYNPMGEMMDMVTLTNSSFNFIIYCLMSSQFRITLKKIFLINYNFLHSIRWPLRPPTPQEEHIPLSDRRISGECKCVTE